MDRLTPIFERFIPHTQVQLADRLCGRLDVSGDRPVGHIHWLRSGSVTVHLGNQSSQTVCKPSVIYLPGPEEHCLESSDGCDIVCAELEFGQRYHNPLAMLELHIIVLPVCEVPEIETVHQLLMQEAFSERCGKTLATSHLLQYFLLVFFRHLIKTSSVPSGIIKALGDDRLLRAVTSIHRDPGHAWTLERLAEVASMSRATFARRFREEMGKTALEYLTEWRMTVAQSLIAKGAPIKTIAPEVGYRSSAALTRVFTQQVGMSPRQWAAHL